MYYLIAFLISAVLLAFSCSGIGMLFLLTILPTIIIAWLLIVAARKLARRNDLPESFFGRFWPLLLPWWLGAVLYVPLAFVYNLLPHSYFVLPIMIFFAGLLIGVFLLAFLIYSEKNHPSCGRVKGLLIVGGLSWACYLAVGASHDWVRANVVLNVNYYDRSETIVAHDGLKTEYNYRPSSWHGVNVLEYTPFQEGEKLAVLPEAPDLRIAENWPRLDGSIALLPLYGAVAKAVYGGLDNETIKRYVVCNNTAAAFDSLLNGEVDIYFGPPLSSAQKEMAQARNLVLTQTPLALEAFVFLVHIDNPVENLSQAQIRRIYTKEITKDLHKRDNQLAGCGRPGHQDFSLSASVEFRQSGDNGGHGNEG